MKTFWIIVTKLKRKGTYCCWNEMETKIQKETRD
jgi:hypothetical protein